ncbi:MAG TPA: hypothetical protein ENI51_07915 [Candidatus Atribacteria bacterium]|nr:hypothetical protein [Candidatus Atribacteria bacterium]
MNLDEFLDFLDKEGIYLCGISLHAEMKEEYCQYYRSEYKGVKHDFCIKNYYDECPVEYDEEQDIYYDKKWIEICKEKEKQKKILEIQKKNKSIMRFLE